MFESSSPDRGLFVAPTLAPVQNDGPRDEPEQARGERVGWVMGALGDRCRDAETGFRGTAQR